MNSLYELTGKYLQLQSVLESGDEEYPVEMLTVGEDLLTKVENYGFILRNFESEENYLEDEIRRLSERKKMTTNAKERMKDMLFNTMKTIGKDKITTPHFKFTVAKKGGKKPLVITGEVPQQYCRIKYEPDKDLIRQAIEEDGEILDFAHVEERGEYLKMR